MLRDISSLNTHLRKFEAAWANHFWNAQGRMVVREPFQEPNTNNSDIRYIKIRKTVPGWLSIGELEVYSRKDNNVKLEKKRISVFEEHKYSDPFNYEYTLDKAFDGKTDTSFATRGENGFMVVDMASPIAIDKFHSLVLKMRTDKMIPDQLGRHVEVSFLNEQHNMISIDNIEILPRTIIGPPFYKEYIIKINMRSHSLDVETDPKNILDHSAFQEEQFPTIEETPKKTTNVTVEEEIDYVAASISRDLLVTYDANDIDGQIITESKSGDPSLRIFFNGKKMKKMQKGFPSIEMNANVFANTTSLALDLSKGYTIECMFMLTKNGSKVSSDNPIIMSYLRNPDSDGVQLQVDSMNRLFLWNFQSDGGLKTTNPINLNEWCHVMVNSKSQMYINGILQQTQGASNTIRNQAFTTRYISIGDPIGIRSITGNFALLRIYKSDVTQSDAKALYSVVVSQKRTTEEEVKWGADPYYTSEEIMNAFL